MVYFLLLGFREDTVIPQTDLNRESIFGAFLLIQRSIAQRYYTSNPLITHTPNSQYLPQGTILSYKRNDNHFQYWFILIVLVTSFIFIQFLITFEPSHLFWTGPISIMPIHAVNELSHLHRMKLIIIADITFTMKAIAWTICMWYLGP